jgi:putative lipoic acid-binding regulatory protein
MTETRAGEAQPEGLRFPCRYPIKVMADSGACPEVLAVVRRHADFAMPDDVRTRPSRNGRFEAITITVAVQTRAELEALYADLDRLDAVKMML